MARLILFPGLGADERMFENLDGMGFPPVTPRHLVPEKGEILSNYAIRVANWLAIKGDDVVGGSSFGGMLASAIARQRTVRGLVLIGSAVDSAGMKGRGVALMRFLPARLLRPLLNSDRLLDRVFAPESAEVRSLAQAMMRDAPEPLLLRGGRMMSAYRPDEKVPCPVFAIHGSQDPVMRPPPVEDCRLIPDAGHGIAWTHGSRVGAFLQHAMDVLAREGASAGPVE